jgi:glucose/arabinose dehydrogenase
MTTKRKLLVALAVFLIAFGGLAFWIWRGTPAKHSDAELSGKDPVIAEPDPETIPSVAIARPVGWAANEAPSPAAGLTVTRFAEGLDHPRTMLTLPNGDVIVALTDAPDTEGGGFLSWIADVLMERAGSHTGSPDTLVLLRDGDGDGKAEGRFVLREGKDLASPSGLAWQDDTLYVANHDAVIWFTYKLGETALTGDPKRLMDLPGGGNHWMRNLVLSPDGKRLYAAVGSASNIGENGMDIEQGRAAIWEYTFGAKFPRQYAQGLRNPNGMAWNPSSGELWTVVNERDQLGPDLVPDYLTNIPVGAHYGWPWIYWKTHDDDRVKSPPPEFIDDFVREPEYGLGAHTAPLGLLFASGGHRLGEAYANGAFIARHGSWNRQPLTGYDVVFVKFDANGNPQAKPLPLLTGFLTGKGTTRGRPTWLAFDKAGGLLVSDDTAGIIWRVIDPKAAPSAAPKPVNVGRMPPQRDLKGDPAAQYSAGFKPDAKVTQ